MTLSEFTQSVQQAQPPADLAPPLSALWQDARQNWDAAHKLVQDDTSQDAAWVHAYLHRKEGDLGNARYWYGRANKPVPATDLSLEQEWTHIAAALLR